MGERRPRGRHRGVPVPARAAAPRAAPACSPAHEPLASEVAVADARRARAEPAQGLAPRDPALAGEGGATTTRPAVAVARAARAGPAVSAADGRDRSRRVPARDGAVPALPRTCSTRRRRRRRRLPPGGDAARARGRGAARAPLRHPQGRGAARARRADAPGRRGGGDVRLHLAHHGRGDARRRRRGGPRRVPAAGRGVPRRSSPTRAFAGHFAVGLAERLKASLDALAGRGLPRRTSRCAVEQLVRRPPVWVDAGATVGDAARRDAGASGSRRCSSAPSRRASSPTATSATASSPRTSARRRRSRGLLAPAPDGRAVDADLRGVDDAPRRGRAPPAGGARRRDRRRRHLGRPAPAAPRRGRSRCCAASSGSPARESLPGYARRRWPRWPRRSSRAGSSVATIAGFVARLNDALAPPDPRAGRRRTSAPPPAPYAWIAFGSEGRMEQTLLTDQDNALVYADEGAARRATGTRRSPSA